MPDDDDKKMLDALRKTINGLIKKEIYQPYEFKTKLLKGEHIGLQLSLKGRLISKDDPLIAEDEHRKWTSNGEPDGDKYTWVLMAGGLYPKAAFQTAIPGAPVNVSIGFSAHAGIGYSVLAPYARKFNATSKLVKDLTVDLPLKAEKARDLKRGAEVLFRGSGRLAAQASIGVGKQFSAADGWLKVDVSAGVSFVVSGGKELALRIKRLEEKDVFVSLSEIETLGSSRSLGAHAGAKSSLRDSLPELGGDIFERPGEIAAKNVEKQIQKWLSADFRLSHTISNTEKEVVNYVFDLSSQKARDAYNDLIRLNTATADKLLEQPGQKDVRKAEYHEKIRSEQHALEADFGKITLLSAVSRAEKTKGVLHTRKGEVSYLRAKLEDGYYGVISHYWLGERRIMRSLISTRFPDTGIEYYYHIRFTVENDKYTSDDDVLQFLELADLLGALDTKNRKLTSLKGRSKFLNSFDDTDRVVDVYITQEGLERLMDAPDEEIMEAFASVYEKFENTIPNKRSWKQTPWLRKNHKDYKLILDLLERPPGESPKNSNIYKRITLGRSLTQDSHAYKEAKYFVKILKEMKQHKDPEKRISILASQDWRLGLDFWKELGMIVQIAGTDQVLVNELCIRDLNHDRHLVFMHEGSIQDPYNEIQAMLADPV